MPDADQLKYKAKLAGYKGAKLIGSNTGIVLTGLLVGATALTQSFDLATVETDTQGTEFQETVLTALQNDQADLIEQVNTYQELRQQTIDGIATDEDLETAQNALKQSSMSFFSDLLINGSTQDGLDIAETDAEELLTTLQHNVRDFDWGTHVDERLPNIISYGINHANYLDEGREDHLYDGIGTLEDKFAVASDIAKSTQKNSENQVFFYMLVVFGSLLGGLFASAGADTLGRKARWWSKPERPASLGKH